MEPKTVEFSRSFLFPWVKGRISLDNRMVKTRRVRTILGVIPAGKDDQTMPLSNISSVAVDTRYDIKSILTGIVAAGVGFMLFTSSPLLGFLLLLVGVVYIGSGIYTLINFVRGGQDYFIRAACYNKKALVEIADIINQALVETELGKDSRTGAADVAKAQAEQTDRLIDAISKKQ